MTSQKQSWGCFKSIFSRRQNPTTSTCDEDSFLIKSCARTFRSCKKIFLSYWRFERGYMRAMLLHRLNDDDYLQLWVSPQYSSQPRRSHFYNAGHRNTSYNSANKTMNMFVFMLYSIDFAVCSHYSRSSSRQTKLTHSSKTTIDHTVKNKSRVF